ncbi:MAG: Gfo/Idh/MocA family oxidoreductase [Firmicutes bacterium]|nr:Gfo/Idh/MocA family oxidoreductase [Bacillota bacterium]
MQEKLRVGIVGVGAIAQAGHIPSYLRRDDVEIIAFADPEESRVREVAKKLAADHGVATAHVYASLAAMVEDVTLDAVSICTPNNSHVELAVYALEHGLHVLLEKPMGLSREEGARLKDVARASGKTLMVGMTHRYREDAAVLKRFVEAGDLGELYYAKTRILRRRGSPTGWFTDAKVSGGGPLMDIGVHALDLTWWLMGTPRPISVSGFLHKGIGNDGLDFINTWQAQSAGNEDNQIYTTEDFAAAFIRFDTGAVLQVEVAWSLNGEQDDALKVDIFGSKGGVSLDPLRYYSVAHRVLTETKPVVGMGAYYEREINHFLECVRTGQTPISNVTEGRTVIDMLCGIAESSRQQAEIRF